ncbi:MAG: hypothetical protein ABR538_11570 [Candidatus Binatia bacterium]
MKRTRSLLPARLALALGSLLTVAVPAFVVTEAEAQGITADDRCRQELSIASRRYLERVLTARISCQSGIINGKVFASVDCINSRGDERLDKKLRRAEDKLTNIGGACAGVSLQLLGFPGVCDDPNGPPFDTADFQQCILTETDEILSQLLDVYYPPGLDMERGNLAVCMRGSPKDAAMSRRRKHRARETCLVGQSFGFLENDVQCREEILPFGAGTGDAAVDRQLARAYSALLGAIPLACVDIQIDDIGYQSDCTDETGGLFTVFDLKQCYFRANRQSVLDSLAIIFPTEAVCGDGNVSPGEECDNGLAGNSDTVPNACRTDCTNPKCHDGVFDNLSGEQCDDGNTVNTDCCVNECVLAVCGDGIQNCTEECDNFPNNGNLPNQCRANCQNPRCGDGVEDTGEECDDGNLTNEDGCSSLCFVEECGDEIKQEGLGEECDEGVDNANEPDKCRATGPFKCKLPGCPDGIVDTGEVCDDGNTNNDDECSNTCAICGDGQKAPSEECDGDSSQCPAGEGCLANCSCEPACPTEGELVLYAGYGQVCDTNADCPVGTCDPGNGRCRTVTRLDSGWTGLAHDSDINDGIRTRGRIECDSHGPVCGECDVVGVDPSTRACRCSNNTRTVCNDPFDAVSSDCPACVGGFRVNGISCGANADCQLAPCSRRCNNNAAVCSSNADCPGSTCANPARCQNNTTVTCTTNTDCPGSTCLPAVTSCGNGLSCTANADCVGSCTGEAGCNCYFGAPFPLASGGTPACIVNRFAEDIVGTANVDLGQGEISAKLRTQVFLGASTVNPCPTCGGRCSNNSAVLCDRDLDCSGGTCQLDPVADDGIRGGVCTNGDVAGLSCDATGTNSSFPAYTSGPNGGSYSLDCLPNVGKNVSGQGLSINLTQTTGTSELAFNVSCGGAFSGFSCPCLLCSGDTSVPCNTHEECSGFEGNCSLGASFRCLSNTDCQNLDVGPCIVVGSAKRCSKKTTKICLSDADCLNETVGNCNPSMCSSFTGGTAAAPNQCNELQCSDIGGGIGECTTGPDALFCNGVVKANGSGVLACTQNADCQAGVIGIDAGECDLAVRQGCFFDPITAIGDPDPSTPIGASSFCIPPTSNGGINSVAGLPGPGRILNQATARTFCGNDLTKQYIPGVGGCLPAAAPTLHDEEDRAATPPRRQRSRAR